MRSDKIEGKIKLRFSALLVMHDAKVAHASGGAGIDGMLWPALTKFNESHNSDDFDDFEKFEVFGNPDNPERLDSCKCHLLLRHLTNYHKWAFFGRCHQHSVSSLP